MKNLLRQAVANVDFKCNKMWYTQSDGLAMGASLAVILKKLWTKSLKKSMQRPNEGKDNVPFQGKGIEC